MENEEFHQMLETLTDIKSQIKKALEDIRSTKIDKNDNLLNPQETNKSQNKTVSKIKEKESQPKKENLDVEPINLKDSNLSRDDVKAQREAKKAAKAEKKASVRAKELTSKPPTNNKLDIKNNKNLDVKNNPQLEKKESSIKGSSKNEEDKGKEKDKKQTPKKDITTTKNDNKNIKEKAPLTITKTTVPGKKTLNLKRFTSGESKVHTLFDHMPRAQPPENIFTDDMSRLENIHSEFYSAGLKYAQGMDGSNKRCLVLLSALKSFVKDYKLPKEKQFKFSFIQELNLNLDFLRSCRPFTIAMDNIVESFKSIIREINIEEDENSIKCNLKHNIVEFEERISKAKEAIISKGQDKISDGDTILVYGSSEILWDIIEEAIKQNNSSKVKKNFSLLVVDPRPFENEEKGRSLNRLRKIGDNLEDVNVTYVGITGLSNYIRNVTKVFLRAQALLNNGSVLGYAGTSQIALLAHFYNIPVLVCCETYKFCDLSPTDSFFLNELGYGFGINKKLISPENSQYLITPVIKYDITPANLCTAVITDVDILPTSAVPAVLRVQETRSFTV